MLEGSVSLHIGNNLKFLGKSIHPKRMSGHRENKKGGLNYKFVLLWAFGKLKAGGKPSTCVSAGGTRRAEMQ